MLPVGNSIDCIHCLPNVFILVFVCLCMRVKHVAFLLPFLPGSRVLSQASETTASQALILIV